MNVENKLCKKRGRKSKDNKELWDRRLKEVIYYARGISAIQIAEQFGINRELVYYDIAEWDRLMEKTENINIRREKMSCLEVIRDGFSRLSKQDEREKDTTVPINLIGASAIYGKILEAIKELAILKGKRGTDTITNINSLAFIRQEIEKDGNKKAVIQAIEDTIKEIGPGKQR